MAGLGTFIAGEDIPLRVEITDKDKESSTFNQLVNVDGVTVTISKSMNRATKLADGALMSNVATGIYKLNVSIPTTASVGKYDVFVRTDATTLGAGIEITKGTLEVVAPIP